MACSRAAASGLAACAAKKSEMVNVGTAKICFLAHEAHGFVAELKSVVNGFDAGARCVQRSRFARGVDCDTIAGARGFAGLRR